jgi:hypothetical protein
MRKRQVPGKAEWAGYESDLDAKYAHGLLFGKEIREVLDLFANGRGIERTSELLFMPRKAFQYYVFAFAEYLSSDKAAGDADAASPFLKLLLGRERQDPGSVAEVFAELSPTVDYVASHQAYFNADPNIYGDFPEQAEAVRNAVALANVPDKSQERTREG